ncbi:8091_t:CDS:2 [Cetraspora pellucida]|uniref:8091_t:CDS:1 n=1 Tax=Cetraspora pellucida TaxID=1433469 RepID=A0A9N9GCX0_9GLOM|nr:8091_t:CDS:2 [Cetraspora pellucida]
MPVNIQVEGFNTTNSSLSVLKQEKLVIKEFFDFTIFKHNQEAVTEEELTIYSQDTSVSDNE